VSWALAEFAPSVSRFTDRLLVACSPACLDAVKRAHALRQWWSTPMPAAAFLDALRGSLELDLDAMRIDVLAGVARSLRPEKSLAPL
jgi:hypothetical protein